MIPEKLRKNAGRSAESANAAASVSVVRKTSPEIVKKLGGEFTRFVVAGIVATLTDFGVLALLVEIFDLHYLLANTVSFIVASTVSYLLSIWWVFDSRRVVNRWREFVWFTLIGAGGLLISQACMYCLVDIFKVGYQVAKVAAVGCTLFWNFGVKKALLFSARRQTQITPK